MKGLESSTAVVFRALIMLSCLIFVPLAAIFGSAFPEVVRSLLIDRFVAHSSTSAAESSGTSSFGQLTAADNPAAGSPQSTRTADSAPAWPAQAPTPENFQASALSTEGRTLPAAFGDGRPGNQASLAAGHVAPLAGASGNVPAAFTAAADRSAWDPPVSSQARPAREPAGGAAARTADPRQQTAVGRPPVRNPGETSQSQPPQALFQQASSARAADVRAIASAPAGGEPERFTAIQRQLRENGAAYYLLETWGDRGELYRFHCKLQTGADRNIMRQFEATDSDALQAMSRVLAQVEAWRAGRVQ